MSLIAVAPRGSSAMPKAPVEISDAAEKWARKVGRSATVHFAPFAGWFVRLSLRSNDKRMIAFREGRAEEPATEDVFFHVKNPFEAKEMSMSDVLADPRFKGQPLIDWWGGIKVRMPIYLQFDILQMGAEGVTSFLEREDTWSGRGKYGSLAEATKKTLESNEAGAEKMRADMEEQAGRRAHDLRRQIGKVPFLRVLADLGQPKRGNTQEK